MVIPRPVEHFRDLGLRVLFPSRSFEGIVFCVDVWERIHPPFCVEGYLSFGLLPVCLSIRLFFPLSSGDEIVVRVSYRAICLEGHMFGGPYLFSRDLLPFLATMHIVSSYSYVYILFMRTRYMDIYTHVLEGSENGNTM